MTKVTTSFDFFLSKSLPFKLFPLKGGQRKKLWGDKYINIADLPCQNAI
jgi:hypothetical protein